MKYIKVIRFSGSYFSREFEKNIKSKKIKKIREVDEKTAAEQFLKGSATIEIVFEDINRKPIELTNESDEEMIKKYLGPKFMRS